MPIQNLYVKYFDQQENSAVFHSLCQKEDKKLLVTNRLLEILIADVENLLRSIECENGLTFNQPDSYARGEITGENNEVDIRNTNCKNIPSSAQSNLSINEGDISCVNNNEDILSNYFKTVLIFDQPDSYARGGKCSENNEVNIRSTNCKNIASSAQSNLSIKERRISCDNNHEDMLSKYCKVVLSSQQSSSCLKGQINFDNNQEILFGSTCFWSIPNCKQSDFSIKRQTNCENIQKKVLLNTDSNTVSSYEQPDSNIKEQMDFENSQENSQKIDFKVESNSEQPDSISKAEINFENNKENSLKIYCKTGFSSEQPDSKIKVQINCENNQENLILKTDSKTGSDSKQPDLRIKCRIFCEHHDLESLNGYFEDVMENGEDNNIALQVRSAEELLPTNKV